MREHQIQPNLHQKPKTAILFDAENISWQHVEQVLSLASIHGKPILRAYADFSRPETKGWQEPALTHGIRTIHQFSYNSKNSSSDFLMMHDAFKLIHSGKIDTFVIVTNDSDFITPIQLLRQSGAYVHGMGNHGRAQKLLVQCCNQFSWLGLSDLASDKECSGIPDSVVNKILKAYAGMSKSENGTVPVGQLKVESDIALSKSAKFSKLLAQTGRFELLENNTLARLCL
ncbi:NYN domain-containing protein [Endozoicomonas lisbonensis]|uniref:Uncharacterized LabA/DUF88 family protein n=1 Tax=Endozoicomonas lisbonensis TaxID=3120522 RepID=A0ABV2SBP7_9GAMM